MNDADIVEVVRLISKWTGKNFIVDPKVQGKITLLGPAQVSLADAYRAFLSALDANNLTTVQSGKFIRIIPSTEASRSPLKTYSGDYAPADDQFITRVFKLLHINAQEAERDFRDIVTRNGKLFSNKSTNSIIVTDNGANIQRMQELLKLLDVKGFETGLHVIEIRNGSAKNISDILSKVYGEDKKNEKNSGDGSVHKILVDEQTNSLIVLANPSGLRALQEMLAKLDVKGTDEGKTHVYYCEYAKADDLAVTLSAISNVKVSANPASNSLVILANAADYRALKAAMKKLDIPRQQVFVEAVMLEMGVTDANRKDVNFGLRSGENGYGGGFLTTSNPDDLKALLSGGVTDGLTVPAFGPSFSANVPGATGARPVSLLGIVQMVTSNTNFSVLSTPQIVALDNEKATFLVQDKIPVVEGVTQASATNGSQTNNALPSVSVGRVTAGVGLIITPHINLPSRSIRLEIEQTVESASDNEVPQRLLKYQKTVSSRRTVTQLNVKDQDFVVLSGLMSDKLEETVKKVPVLGDIPVLGWLFKSENVTAIKTNLIVLLRPRIIGTTVSSSELTSEALRQREQFREKNGIEHDPVPEAYRP